MFRLPDDRALLNRLGFNNHGAGELALRLARHTPDVPIGVNIGKTKIVPAERAVDDYRESARLVGPLAAYLVVNVSSPNTPGLRDLQAVESLRPILAAVREETTTPVLVKIAPDLSDSDIDEIADLAVELGLAGIVATNTTVSRDGLATPGVDELGPGGISGPPVARRSAEVLRRLYRRAGDRLVLISVGGIETADDAWDRITSGASLLQGYTGFVYGGGLWAKHIHDGIARHLHEGGFASLADARRVSGALVLFVGAVDDRPRDRLLKEVEPEVSRRRPPRADPASPHRPRARRRSSGAHHDPEAVRPR